MQKTLIRINFRNFSQMHDWVHYGFNRKGKNGEYSEISEEVESVCKKKKYYGHKNLFEERGRYEMGISYRGTNRDRDLQASERS